MASVLTYFDSDADGEFTRRGQGPVNPPPPTSPYYLLDENFDGRPSGPVTVTEWNTWMAGGQAGGSSSELARFSVVTNPDLGGQALEMTLLGGQSGTAGGSTMSMPLIEQHDAVWYEVKYKLGGGTGAFDFGKGLKCVGGLCGTKPGVALSFPSGCKTITDEGFSHRHMAGYGTVATDRWGLTYNYGTDASEAGHACGEPGYWRDPPGSTSDDQVLMDANVWHVTRDYVQLNTVTPSVLSDGIVKTWHNDLLVFDRTNRKQRVRSDVHVGGWQWSWFYGGDSTWAPTSDQKIWVDYIKIWIET